MKIRQVLQAGLGALIVVNVVCFFTIEQAASYASFYPGSSWRQYHLALSVELTEVALAAVFGSQGLRRSSWAAGAILVILFVCSVYFSGLHQFDRIELVQSKQMEFDRRREVLKTRLDSAAVDIKYFKSTRQKGNVAMTVKEIARLTERQEQLVRPAQSVVGLQVQIWAIFALRFAVKFAALFLVSLLGGGFRPEAQKSTAEPGRDLGSITDKKSPVDPFKAMDQPEKPRNELGRFIKQTK